MENHTEIAFTINGVEFRASGIDIRELLHALPAPKKRKRKIRQEQKKARRKNRE